jgi:hypothetical protein
MLKKEQIRPFLLGALFTAGVIVITNYVGEQSGYVSCVTDVIESYHQEDVKDMINGAKELKKKP